MTEAQWQTSGDVRAMLAFAEQHATDRRLRVFVLACCRSLWGNSPDGATRVALGLAEQFLPGGGGSMMRRQVMVAAGQAVIDCGATDPVGPLLVCGEGGGRPLHVPALAAAIEVLACAQRLHGRVNLLSDWFAHAGLDPCRQADLLRDVFRAPFRTLHFRPAWRTLNDGAAGHVAREIERDGAFELFPVLADALMDAGCGCEEILGHLQGPGPHVRGCWGLDVVLGRC